MAQVMENPSNTGSLVIPAAKRLHGTAPWFKDGGFPVVHLYAHNLDKPSFQECQVRFNPLSTPGLDQEYDGRYLPGYAPRFFIEKDGVEYGVLSIPLPPEDLAIPFTFVKNDGSHFRIEVSVDGDLPWKVWLRDRQTDREQCLTDNPGYDFTAYGGETRERFEVWFMRGGGGGPPGRHPVVSSRGNTLVVNAPCMSYLEVFGINGRSLCSKTVAGPGIEHVVLNTPPGCYLVRLTSSKEVTVSKVFIQSSVQ
jgi:hypothetical protein